MEKEKGISLTLDEEILKSISEILRNIRIASFNDDFRGWLNCLRTLERNLILQNANPVFQ